MTKKAGNRRSQPEFLFVFTTESNTQAPSRRENTSECTTERKALSADVVKTHRERLIKELREFGC